MHLTAQPQSGGFCRELTFAVKAVSDRIWIERRRAIRLAERSPIGQPGLRRMTMDESPGDTAAARRQIGDTGRASEAKRAVKRRSRLAFVPDPTIVKARPQPTSRNVA